MRLYCFSFGLAVASWTLSGCGARIDGQEVDHQVTAVEHDSRSSGGSAASQADEASGGDEASAVELERSACVQCRGDWGLHGWATTPSCNCRTTDSGKRCESISDCEGQCLLEPPEERVVTEGPPRLGFRSGRCSEFVRTYGCHPTINETAPSQVPIDLDEALPVICID